MLDFAERKNKIDRKIIVIVNGYQNSGKTEFEKFVGEYKPTMIRSSIDCVKEFAIKYFGWDGNEENKTDEIRLLLQQLKVMLVSEFDYIFKDVLKTINKFYNTDDIFLMIDVREPKEIERFKSSFGAVTVFIERDECKNTIINPADVDVENYQYDYTIKNNGTLEDLKFHTKWIVDLIIEKREIDLRKEELKLKGRMKPIERKE